MDLPAQDLATALRQLSAQQHIELLFDATRMVGRRSAPVHRAANADAALRELLAGTGFVARRGDFSAWLVVPQASGETPTPAPAATAAMPAVAEILVLGSRSLNTAIRRSENDIQPYTVLSSEALTAAMSGTVDDFLRARDPDDAQAGSLAQAPVANGGAVRSRIDLGGLGTDQTLVLVDGRRLPSIPGQDVFQQADLNGIPLAAIDHIETLTSTAGGIYGPGATGGVVNVVLKHDYNGGEIDLNGGGTTRADAPHWRFDGDWGHSFHGGDTQVMLAVSHAEDAGLTQGQRSFAAQARQLLSQEQYLSAPPISAGLNVNTSGVSTYKPLNLPLASGGLAALNANVGGYDTALSPDGQGAMQSLLSRTRSNAVLFDLRQVATSRIDLFVNALYFQSEGVATGPRTQPTVVNLNQGQSGDPFNDPNGTDVSFPTSGLAADSVDDDQTLRVTAGAIARLSDDWNGEVDLTYGRASDTERTPTLIPITGSLSAIDLFDSGAGIDSLFSNPPPDEVVKQINDMLDASLRLSGSVANLPAGPATMTVLGEFRREHQPDAFVNFTNYNTEQATPIAIGPQSQTISSAYVEVRAPLLARDATFVPLRGLELQFAGRFDSETTTAPADDDEFTSAHTLGGTPFTGGANTFAFTTGLRVFPLDGLMLRASVATGYLPPTAQDLIEGVFTSTPANPVAYVVDPKRGNTLIGSTGSVTYQADGSPSVQPEHARTISAGFVATPAWAPGLRVSIDYTRIDKTHEITGFADYDFQFFLDNEAQFPSRVTRGPLTAADVAAGYTAGPVIDINSTALNTGRSTVQTVDVDASYERATAVGRFHLYTRATWEPDYRREDDPQSGFYQTAGHIGGPLTFRSNSGLGWSFGHWSADLNVQVYGPYAITYTDPTLTLERQTGLNRFAQGGSTIPAQTYLDLELAYRLPLHGPGGLRSVEYRFGVHDILDTQPPLLLIDANTTQPAQSLYYSPYGDPRGRRIDFTMVGRF